jgi:hypothetical protein
MKTLKRAAILLMLLPALLAGASSPRANAGELQLKPIHPDETVAQTLNQRFSLANALTVIAIVRDWLESFRRLTAAAKDRISAGAWKEVGNTEWDVQTLGFANMPRSLEGALRYQNWQLKKALHQLAMMEEQAGKAQAQKTEQARSELEQAAREFQAFWDSMAIAD